MAGWFEAFANFSRGAAPALDRYQALRQLDEENQFKRKQQEMNDNFRNSQIQLQQGEMANRARVQNKQIEQIDQAILGQKQQQFQNTHFAGSELDDAGYQQAQELGLGGLTRQHQIAQEPNIDLSQIPSIGAEGEIGANEAMPLEMMPGQPSRNQNQYMGTPAQMLAERDRQQKLRMLQSVVTGLDDPYAKAQAVMGNPIIRPPVDPYRAPIAVTGEGVTPATLMDPRVAVEKGLQQYYPPRATGSRGSGNTAGTEIDMELVQRGAQAVLEGRLAPSQAASLYGGMGAAGAAYKRAITDEVLKQNPKWSATAAESNYSFGKAPGTQTTVRFMDNIKNTIPMMRDMVKKMKLSDIKVVNSVVLATSGQFGKGEVAAYDFMTTILADEIAKILQGGGTGSATSDTKLKQAMDLMGHDMSPDQWGQVLDAADEMLKVRRGSMTKGTYMEEKQKPKMKLVNGVWEVAK